MRRGHRRPRGLGRRGRPEPELPERARRVERPGRLGVRGRARARARGSPRRRGSRRPPHRGRLSLDGDDGRHRPRADGAPGARVGRPSDRARPRLRDGGGLRGHELPEARRPRQPPLWLRAHEHHGRSDDATGARHLRLGRRGRGGAAPARRRGWDPHGLPRVARDLGTHRSRPRRLDARRQLEPDAARPHDEPPPRARRGDARGPPRRRRRRPLPVHEQELVDRRQAPQLPVRDRRSPGRSRRESSGRCCATRPTWA